MTSSVFIHLAMELRLFSYIRTANLSEKMSVQGEAPLRILILLNRVPFPLNDGGAIGTFGFVKGYVEAGAQVHTLAMNTTKHFVEEQTAIQHFKPYSSLTLVNVDNRIKPIGALRNLFAKQSYITERFDSADYRTALEQILHTHTFDVVHLDGLPAALYLSTLRQLAPNAHLSMRAHNVEHVIWERIAAQETNSLKKWYLALQAARLKHFEIKAAAEVDTVMAISQEDKDAMLKACPTAKTLIVPAGMDIADEKPKGNDEVYPLTFIGSFDWMPNLQGVEWFFSEVWSKLSAKFPDAKLHLAGKKMPAHIKALQSIQVNPIGEVPDAKQFLLDGGVMVVPIVSGSGIRIKILEGMALGKCIIATPIAAEGLGLTNEENILIADTAAQFEHYLSRCITQPDFRLQIAQNAHKFALNNFQNKTIFKHLIQYYRQHS
jgi:glycosyltransferase involved in cell wall biosynthesis